MQELHIERTASRGIVGNLYLGKVVRVLPGMQSAFIDIGLERTAFLHVADIWSYRQNGEGAPPDREDPHRGPEPDGAGAQGPIGTKGARLSTQVSLAGRLLVFLPQDRHIGISQRIEDEAGTEAVAQPHLVALVPGRNPAASSCAPWPNPPPTPSSPPTSPTCAACGARSRLDGRPFRRSCCTRTWAGPARAAPRHRRPTSRIRDSRGENPEALRLRRQYMPQVLPLLEHYSGDARCSSLYSVEEEIQKALARRSTSSPAAT